MVAGWMTWRRLRQRCPRPLIAAMNIERQMHDACPTRWLEQNNQWRALFWAICASYVGDYQAIQLFNGPPGRVENVSGKGIDNVSSLSTLLPASGIGPKCGNASTRASTGYISFSFVSGVILGVLLLAFQKGRFLALRLLLTLGISMHWVCWALRYALR